jgi:hypothetical protein
LNVLSLLDNTVVRDEAGLYAYAKLSDDGKLVPSSEKVGRSPPKSANKYLRPPGLNNIPLNEEVSDAADAVVATNKRRRECPRGSNCEFSGRSLRGSSKFLPTSDQHHRRTATIGTLKNLVILIKFRDHNRRTVPTKEEINVLMNSEEVDPIYAPTGSLKMVYWENSYGQLTIESHVTDWIRVSRRESYYAAGESGVGSNRLFQEALMEVLDQLESQGFDFKDFDQDNDSHIDSIAFLTSGYGAEWGGGKRRSVVL